MDSKSPLLFKSKSGSHANDAIEHDNERQSNSGASSATGIVVLSTFVAVSGSYVFGSGVSSLLLYLPPLYPNLFDQ